MSGDIRSYATKLWRDGRDLLRRFADDRRGVVAVVFVMALVPVMALGGAAIDVSRAYIVKQRLSFALDAAALAVGSSHGSDAELTEVMQRFFDANYPAHEIGVPATPSIAFTEEEITLSATAQLDTSLMKIVGLDSLNVAADTKVLRETTGLEVALVLDNTGSMRGSRIGALKIAAEDFVDILFRDQTVAEHLFVSVVPFSGSVNIGTPDEMGITTDSPDGAGAWSGCVEARPYPADVRDGDIATDGFWPRLESSSSGSTGQCPVLLQPLTNRKADVVAKIGEMTTQGYTHINYGAVWGWRVLSPEAPYTEGKAYDDPDYDKAIVIMTDGQNTMPSDSLYTAYGRISQGRLGTTSRWAADDVLDDRLLEICTALKDLDVLVYTITFEVSNSSVRSLMEDCATDPSKYYDSPSAAQLRSAFRAIGAQLSNLRIGR